MGIAGSGAIRRLKEYTESISIIFAPILFAHMGAQMNFAALFSGSLTGIRRIGASCRALATRFAPEARASS
jgi:Kef-type K+ transport system membrane component KefB